MLCFLLVFRLLVIEGALRLIPDSPWGRKPPSSESWLVCSRRLVLGPESHQAIHRQPGVDFRVKTNFISNLGLALKAVDTIGIYSK